MSTKGENAMKNSATETLRREHEAILSMLGAAEKAAERLGNGDEVPPGILNGILEFFQMFADRCHHGKEEDLLFPLLEKKGLPRQGGPIGVMLHEHTIGRGLIREMAAAGKALESGDSSAGVLWARAALQYSGLLSAHIQKENDILFVMAERLLTDAEQAQLSEAFEAVENDKMGPGTHERLHAKMTEIQGELLESKAGA
jgi:hemerythrin-like domain-containing protein